MNKQQSPVFTSMFCIGSAVVAAGAWFLRWSLPAVHPAHGGPDPALVVKSLAVSGLVCAVLTGGLAWRATRMRSAWSGVVALLPGSYVAMIVLEFLRSVLFYP